MPTLNIDPIASPRIITVLSPDTAITIQELVDLLRDWEDDPVNLAYTHLIAAAGKDALGGGVFVGLTATLLNAKLAFEARPGPSFVRCDISGGNLVAVDENGNELDPIQTTAYTQIVRTSSSSATLQELADIQFASFNGGVTIDATSSFTGTAFPVGTRRQPVNNLPDALAIAASRGFKKFFVVGNLTIGGTINVANKIFIGDSPLQTGITVDASANTVNVEFSRVTLDGTLDGNSQAEYCHIGNLTYLSGHISTCLLVGTIVLSGGAACHVLDCWDGLPGAGVPTIDMGGSGQALNVRNYSGGLQITNKNGTDSVSVGLNGGRLLLDSTVTNGDFIVRGTGKLVDQSTGTTVDAANLLQYGAGANDSVVLAAVEILLRNKRVLDPVTGIETVYDADGTSVLFTRNVYEDTGGTAPYDGTAAPHRVERYA